MAVRVLITGVCGFVGSTLACALQEAIADVRIVGIDSLIRPGSELNRIPLRRRGIQFQHADIRNMGDLESLPPVDWVIDAAASASVLAGIQSRGGTRGLFEHNLFGTVNLLEYCRKHRAGFILLSTSRVYSIVPLCRLKMDVAGGAFQPASTQKWPEGCSLSGVTEDFSTEAPISLYGASKLASETLAAEYGHVFDFPVRINRCGVLAGAGQFGRIDQGIFSFWVHSYAARRPLRYVGFEGSGCQVRDCLHPRDLVPLLVQQMQTNCGGVHAPLNVGGGISNSTSLAQLSAWCESRFGKHEIQRDLTPRPFDIPWMVLDSSGAEKRWDWRPATALTAILTEIAQHAEANPSWLDVSIE